MIRFIINLLFVGVSLQSFYFYEINAPLISIISLLFLSILLIWKLKFILNLSNYSIGFYASIILFSLFSLIYFRENIVFTKFFGFLLVLFTCFVANVLFSKCNIPYLIKFYLLIHIAFFYLQFFAHYLFNIPIDFLVNITGEEQRVFGGSFELPISSSFMRASGLFNEPGTYVTFIAPFIALFGRWSKSFSKADFLIYFSSLLTLFLSFSVFGFVFGSFILVFASFFSKIVRLTISGLVSFFLVIPYLTYRFFLQEINIESDSGLGFREIFINESFKFISSDFGAIIFGSGHLSLDPKANFIASYNDIGLLPYLFHFSGPILTSILIVILVKIMFSLDKFSNSGIIILFISKLSILAPFFPIILTLLLWAKSRKDSLTLENLIV